VQAFRAAVEAQDIEAAIALLADDVVFNSPVVFKPYQGREAVGVLLRAVFEVFQDFRYLSEVCDGPDIVLVFEARVGDRDLQGADFLHLDEADAIDRFTVMVRPLNATLALAEAMQAQLSPS